MPNYSSLLSGYNTSLQNATTNYNNMQRDVMTEHGNAMARMQGGMHEPGRYNVLHGAGSRPGFTAGQPIILNSSQGNKIWGSGSKPKLFGGFREKGGPVTPGKAYVVGEKRPELFIPDEPGRIVNISRKSVFNAMKR